MLEIQETESRASLKEEELPIETNMKKIGDKHSNKGQQSFVRFAIEIEDSGVGMSEENQRNLFVDFMKVQEHKSMNPRGTGLGLSICKLIVEKMRGEIQVQSKVGVGTTFKILLRSTVQLENNSKFRCRSSKKSKIEDEMSSQFESLKRIGGFLHLSSNTFLAVNNNASCQENLPIIRSSQRQSIQYSAELPPGKSLPKSKFLLVNDEPF